MAEQQNKIRFGLENVHIAFMKPDNSWEAPVHIPGVVNFSSNPDGSENAFYADNTKYYVRYSNNGYTGDLEMALFPDEILAEMLGWEFDNSGVLVEDAAGNEKAFALIAQVQGDVSNRRFVFYNCVADRPSQTHATTTESITPTTETMNISMLPFDFGDKKIVRAIVERSEETAEVYDSFFDEVFLPDFGQEG